jgi:hypothetical protein
VTKLFGFFRAFGKSPILWGLLAATAFYSLIHAGPLSIPFIERYFTHHPVEYMETVLFSVGLAALVLKAMDIAGQYAGLSRSPISAAAPGAAPIEACPALLEQIDRAGRSRQTEYYVRRLRDALEHVRLRGSAESLGDELKYLADIDVSRLHTSYGLFRVVVWAIPILGFLGTVMGITIALNGVDLQAPDQSMVQVLTGLGLKFDTTALALTLSMVLMFVHFFVDRVENSLLEAVDERVQREMLGRFPLLPSGPDGQVAAIRRMAETMIHVSERLVQRQAELWQASLNAAAARWTQMADAAGEHLKKGLSGGLAEGLRTYAQQLAAAEQTAAEQNRQQWEKVQQTQVQGVQAMASLQADLSKQTQILERAVVATGEVVRLEDVLNRNLTALAGAKHFEQTVMSLAAAIHLLNARLAETETNSTPVKLEPPRRAA